MDFERFSYELETTRLWVDAALAYLSRPFRSEVQQQDWPSPILCKGYIWPSLHSPPAQASFWPTLQEHACWKKHCRQSMEIFFSCSVEKSNRQGNRARWEIEVSRQVHLCPCSWKAIPKFLPTIYHRSSRRHHCSADDSVLWLEHAQRQPCEDLYGTKGWDEDSDKMVTN